MQVSYYKSKHKDSNLQKFFNLFMGLRQNWATFQNRKCRYMGIKKEIGSIGINLFSSESGTRTRVSAVRGRRARPLH